MSSQSIEQPNFTDQFYRTHVSSIWSTHIQKNYFLTRLEKLGSSINSRTRQKVTYVGRSRTILPHGDVMGRNCFRHGAWNGSMYKRDSYLGEIYRAIYVTGSPCGGEFFLATPDPKKRLPWGMAAKSCWRENPFTVTVTGYHLSHELHENLEEKNKDSGRCSGSGNSTHVPSQVVSPIAALQSSRNVFWYHDLSRSVCDMAKSKKTTRCIWLDITYRPSVHDEFHPIKLWLERLNKRAVSGKNVWCWMCKKPCWCFWHTSCFHNLPVYYSSEPGFTCRRVLVLKWSSHLELGSSSTQRWCQTGCRAPQMVGLPPLLSALYPTS